MNYIDDGYSGGKEAEPQETFETNRRGSERPAWQGPEESARVGGSPRVNPVCSGNDHDGEHLSRSIPALVSPTVNLDEIDRVTICAA
ncbi:hypothetical protein [Sinorhizobium meliloti]|uniref:hypothetical protein n=1 Tax=Rhizobium meliloti TaxID=382 RepID=UPI00398CD1EA